MEKRKITIINKLGLHARAAAKFVSTASTFASELQVKKGDHTVNGKSIMGVMMLAASKGTELALTTEGKDEKAQMEAICTLIQNKFEEEN